MIDLHMHSRQSDGSDTPSELMSKAVEAGCVAVALTDHDTVSGIPEATVRAHALSLELIPGVELSSHTSTRNVHILGYFVDTTDEVFLRRLESQREMRASRNVLLAQRLQEIGLHVELEEVTAISGNESTGRPHFAAAMMARGYVSSIDEAFLRYLGDGAPAFVERQELPASEAIRWIREAGGVASWAHPYPRSDASVASLESVVEELASYGLTGVEARYSRYDSDRRQTLARIAKRHQLVATGGSDYHGTYKPDLAIGAGLGDLHVPYAVIEELRSRLPN